MRSARTRRTRDTRSSLLPAMGRAAVSPARLRAALALLGALVLYEMAESIYWGSTLWGAHFYRFWPTWTWLAAPLALVFLVPGWLRPAAIESGSPTARGAALLPWIAAVAAGILFWCLRERHLLWGDSLPLSILIPQGQSFHPDEPLSLFLHHLIYRLGGGRFSGATAVALGSVLSGALFVGWSVSWFSRRVPALGVALLAVAALSTQGFTQIFYGHVENYSYLALCVLLFFTLGVDFLEGRRGPLLPLLAALLAFAFHILGGLLLVPAVVLIVQGLRDRARRAPTVIAVILVAGIAVAAGMAASPLYGGESPWTRFVGGAFKVLGNPLDARADTMFSLHHLADVWSELVLLGPLSLPMVLLVLFALGSAAFLRRPAGAFLLVGSLVLIGPSLLTGAGNLGAARNWDLFAAPAVSAALLGLVRVALALDLHQARRLLLAILAVSIFHSAPWIALNTSFERASARAAMLPLGGGRGPMMLGTHFLNAGDLPRAEQWFRRAVGEDSTNVNAQSGLGLALARQGKWLEAVGPMSAAVRLKPSSLALRRDRIALWVALERCEPALADLEMVLGQDPYDRRSWLTLADCRLRMSQPDTAAFALENGLRYVVEDAEMERLLGDAYEQWVLALGRLQQWDEARRALERFAARFPDDPRVARFRQGLP